MPRDEYIYTDRTWDMLAEREIDWQDVHHVLHTPPRSRKFFGDSTLAVAGLDRRNRAMRVVLLELTGTDDVYEVFDAYYLEGEQS